MLNHPEPIYSRGSERYLQQEVPSISAIDRSESGVVELENDQEVRDIVDQSRGNNKDSLMRDKANSFSQKRADFTNVSSRFDKLYNKRIDY